MIHRTNIRRLRVTIGVTVAVVALAFSVIAAADDWPQFRGTGAGGIGDGHPPIEWNVETGTNIKWKLKIPGLAHASPIIAGDRVYITTAVPTEDTELRLTRGWEAADGRPAEDPETWSWRLFAIDRDSGKIVWEEEFLRGAPKGKRHPKATHANCTPATDGKHLINFLGSDGLFCHDMNGKLLWKKNLGTLNASPTGSGDLQWGFASSPVIHDGQVIVQCDCENTNFWATFDIRTGKELRRVTREEDSTWATPSVFTIDGKPQVVLNGYKHMGGYDLRTGEELWKLHGGGDVPVPAPLFANGLVFLTNSHGGQRPIYAINPTARGDLTPSDGTTPDGLVWWTQNRGSYMPTPIVYQDNLYVCDDRGILTVYDAATGKQHYRKRLAGGGVNYTASAVAAGGRVYFTNEDGDVHVIKAGNEYELLASNSMNEVCMATPAISAGAIFIRTRNHLYCVGK